MPSRPAFNAFSIRLQQFARENVVLVDEDGGMGESAEFERRVGLIDTIDGATQKARDGGYIFDAPSEEDEVSLLFPPDSLPRTMYSRSI